LSPPPPDAGAPGAGWAKLAVLAAAVCFATTGTAQAKGPAGTTPLGVGAMRVIVGAAALVAYVAAGRRRAVGAGSRTAGWRPSPRQRLLVGVGAAGVALYQPMFFAGTARSGVAVGTIVALGSGPVFVGLWEIVGMRRRPSNAWFAATGCALIGGAILVLAQSGDGAAVDVVGVLCALAAGCGYAMYAVAAKVLVVGGVGSSVVMAWFFAGGALLLTPALFTEPLAWLGTAGGVVMVLHLGVVTVAVAYVLYGIGLRSLPASTAATLTLAEPVVAAVLGVVVLDEQLGAAGWLGAVVVVAGLALTGVRRPFRRDEALVAGP
jgi:DME family drug/metabolite transporter